MLNSKINNKNKFFILLLLAYFAISGTVLAVHNFTHQIAKNFPEKIISDSQNSFFAKIFFIKKDNLKTSSNHQNHGFADCNLCSSFALNNHLLLSALISFLILSHYFANNFLVTDKIKSSFLRSSFLSRAPPAIS